MLNKYKVIGMSILLISLLAIIVFAIPIVEFIPPTQANATNITSDYYEINVSITESNIANITYNWNGTNYSMYNNSLVLMYNFDNITDLGENEIYIVDMSPSKINLTATVPMVYGEGRYGGAYEYNESAWNYIKAMTANFRSTDHNGTITAWIKPMRAITQTVFSSADETQNYNYLELRLSSGGALELLTLHGAGTFTRSSTGVVITIGEWQHIAAVSNGTEHKLYVDGELKTLSMETGESGSWFADIPDRDNVAVGCMDNQALGASGVINRFNGTIDNVKVWSYPLSDDEIQQEYQSNLNRGNSTHWFLYVNQSVEEEGDYTYFTCATNTTGDEACTNTNYITRTDTCSYSSGNWVVDCSDDCSITAAVAIDAGANISIIGTGTFSTVKNITGWTDILIKGTDTANRCMVYCNGGCFVE